MIEIAALAAECAPQVHPITLSAIVQQESARNPYAINVNDDSIELIAQPSSKSEAVELAESLLAAGHNIDVGIGQINSQNFKWLGVSAADLFDPCTNLKAIQAVLTDCYTRAQGRYAEQQQALHAALSCYNTGSFTRGLDNGYVLKVAGKAGVVVPALQSAPFTKTQKAAANRADRQPAFPSTTGKGAFRGVPDQFTRSAQQEGEPPESNQN